MSAWGNKTSTNASKSWDDDDEERATLRKHEQDAHAAALPKWPFLQAA